MKKKKDQKTVQPLYKKGEDKSDAILKGILRLEKMVGGHGKKLNSHGKILNNHSKMLNSQGKMLNSQGKMLNNHSKMLNSHSKMLESQAEKLNSHSKMLESHTKLLEENQRRSSRIIDKLLEVDRKVDQKVDKTEFRAYQHQILGALDGIAVRLDKQDKEQAATHIALYRHDDELEAIKKKLQLTA